MHRSVGNELSLSLGRLTGGLFFYNRAFGRARVVFRRREARFADGAAGWAEGVITNR
jgi:hypothetical protein